MGKPTGGENWGMGLLFVFFPDEPIVNKPEIFSSSPFRRTNSNPILSKAQSTISICFLLVCFTFLLFTLSTFEPTVASAGKPQINSSRRLMSEKMELRSKFRPKSRISSFWVRRKWRERSDFGSESALQGMGALYRRGTRSMSDLVVGHLVENVTVAELRLFLRLLHRSGLTAKSDLVLVFDSPATTTKFGPVIEEENESFLRLIDRYRNLNTSSSPESKPSPASFDVTRFVEPVETGKEPGEPFWGKKKRTNSTESTRASYGSVVGFDATELDPENSLSGFVPRVPMGLRRWACYPMLLGRVRRNFKHTILVDVKNLLILGDPLGRVRNRRPESVLLSAASSGKTHSRRSLNPAIVIGGSRGVRRLATAMLTEIAVAATQQRRKKNPVTESGVLSQLAGKDDVMKRKGIDLMTSAEPVPEASSLSSSPLMYGGNGNGNGNNYNEVKKMIMKQICCLERDSIVYGDC